MQRLIISLVFFFLLQSSAYADFKEGLSAYHQGDYKTAFNEFTILAEQGNASAQYNLGVMYENGEGVKQDYFKAKEWYTKAAEQGDASAQYRLGGMYSLGRGVRQDYFKAKEWFGKACDNGNENGCRGYAILNK